MRSARFWITPALASTMVLAGWGCGESKPAVDTTTAEAKVSGVVRVRGKPMDGGEVSFDPSNMERQDAGHRKATIGHDGSYSVTTLQGRNVGPDLRPDGQEGAATGLRHSHLRGQAGRQPLRHRPPAQVTAHESGGGKSTHIRPREWSAA